MDADPRAICSAEVVLPSGDLGETLAFFTGRLGFAVEAIQPADDPVAAVISGYGVRLRIQRGFSVPPVVLRVACAEPQRFLEGTAELTGGGAAITAPNGVRIEFVCPPGPVGLPPADPVFAICDAPSGRDSQWRRGRAGMQYRDLIPGRLGGFAIASHIRIPDAGPVPDYVHYHEVAFQLIYCRRGRALVVYEDQGPPFWLDTGDCVLQPPGIRHRVLESTAGFEAVEVVCPAEHPTCGDAGIDLPNAARRPERVFGGQRFVCSRRADAVWTPCRRPGLEARDLGIAAATGGRAAARVLRAVRAVDPEGPNRSTRLLFLFVLEGAVTLHSEEHADRRLGAGAAFTLPIGTRHALVDPSEELELLEVALPED